MSNLAPRLAQARSDKIRGMPGVASDADAQSVARDTSHGAG